MLVCQRFSVLTNSSKVKLGFLLVQWAGCGSKDCGGSLGALGNRGFLGPTFPAVVPNMQDPALSSQLCRSDPRNPENVGLADNCRLPSAELSDVVFAMFPKAFVSHPWIGRREMFRTP